MKIFNDMDDNQYWMTLWTMGFTLIMATFAMVMYFGVVENHQMEQMINRGHDPLELACLFNGSSTTEGACLLLARAKAKLMLEKNNVPE